MLLFKRRYNPYPLKKERSSKGMKKKEIRKYLRRADDYMEKIEKKMRCIDSTLFFISLGMEYFYQQEDCQQSNMVQLVKDYLKQ